MKFAVFAVVVLALAYSQSVQAGLECDGCKFVMGKLQGYLENNTKFENETVTLIDDDICAHFPEKYQDQCSQIAAAYIPSMMESLESKYLDPDTVCDALKLCKEENVLLGSTLKGKLECKLCTLAVDWVGERLDSNNTEAAVEQDVEKLCKLAPGGLEQVCESAVEAETPNIMQFIASKLVNDACTDLHLCDSEVEKKADSNGLECSTCELVIDKLQSYVENSTTLDDKIESFLENDFCTLLPASIQGICNSTVATETPDIMYSLADKFLNGETDCTALHLCKSNQPALFQMQSGSELECAICQKATQFLDAEVFESPKVEQFTVDELNKVCGLLPSTFATLCEAAATQAAPAVMQKVGQFIASQGCDDIGVCNN